ncbi:UNVERIFIED_CONTAM: hypothetical protein FKN15_075293 [Acipenser sinensis]
MKIAIGMIEGGLSVREFARRKRCSASTIGRLVQRNQDTGSVRDRPCPKRQRVTTLAQVSIFKQDNAMPHSTRIAIARLQENRGLAVPRFFS